MFNDPHVYAVIDGFGCRVKDARENDKNHILEASFEMPLTYDIAHDILPAMADDLFVKVGDEMQPRPEMKNASFDLKTDTYIVKATTHPEIDSKFSISGATLRKISAYKADGGTWLLGFTIGWTIGQDDEVLFILHNLTNGVYLTFMVQEPKMDFDAKELAGEGAEATVDDRGNVTDIKSKKRGRKKKADEPAADATE